MSIKNFLLAGSVGGVVDFLLGWVFYGILFSDFFGAESKHPDITFIFLGCLFFSFALSYVIIIVANRKTAYLGAKIGAAIGFFYGMSANFFDGSMNSTAVDFKKFAADVIIVTVMGTIVGSAIALVNKALSKKEN